MTYDEYSAIDEVTESELQDIYLASLPAAAFFPAPAAENYPQVKDMLTKQIPRLITAYRDLQLQVRLGERDEECLSVLLAYLDHELATRGESVVEAISEYADEWDSRPDYFDIRAILRTIARAFACSVSWSSSELPAIKLPPGAYLPSASELEVMTQETEYAPLTPEDVNSTYDPTYPYYGPDDPE